MVGLKLHYFKKHYIFFSVSYFFIKINLGNVQLVKHKSINIDYYQSLEILNQLICKTRH